MNEQLPDRLRRFEADLEAAAARALRAQARRRRLGATAGVIAALVAGGVVVTQWPQTTGGQATAAQIIREVQANIAPKPLLGRQAVVHQRYILRQWGDDGAFLWDGEYWRYGCATRVIQRRVESSTGPVGMVPGAEEARATNGDHALYDPRNNTVLRTPRDPRDPPGCDSWTEAQGIGDALSSGDYEIRGERRTAERRILVIGRVGEPADHYTEIDADRRVPIRVIQPPGFYSGTGVEYRWPIWIEMPATRENLTNLDLVTAHPDATVRDVDIQTWWTVRGELFGGG